jgi:hypothetical protein
VIENKGPAQALIVTSLGAIQAKVMTESANSMSETAPHWTFVCGRPTAPLTPNFSNRNIPLLEALLTLAKPMTLNFLIATRTPIRPAQGDFTP